MKTYSSHEPNLHAVYTRLWGIRWLLNVHRWVYRYESLSQTYYGITLLGVSVQVTYSKHG